MILQNDLPFSRRVKFLHDNVCEMPPDLHVSKTFGIDGTNIVSGLRDFLFLLKDVYTDMEFFRTGEDRKDYNSLFAGVLFLYAFCIHGELRRRNGEYSIDIDKSVLNQQYRKGNAVQKIRFLERHGLAFSFKRSGIECQSMDRATKLVMTCKDKPYLLPALKYFANKCDRDDEGELIADRQPEWIYNKWGIFAKGDYSASILRIPIRRDSIDPLRSDILATVAGYSKDWKNLVTQAIGYKLSCSGFVSFFSTPSWGVSFFEKGKKPIMIFTLASNRVFIEFTLPVEAAECIIAERRSFSKGIRQRIESFHCMRCSEKCKGKNIKRVDGVALCKGRAEARRIYMILSEPEDFQSIRRMMELVYNNN
ncbi:MAG: hypothetical protein QXP20_05700 [Candidatus Bathyarchaeia archaeon]